MEVVVLFADLLIGVVTFRVLFDVFEVETVVFTVTATDVLVVEANVIELFIFVTGVVSFAFGVGEGFGDSVRIFLTFLQLYYN